MNCKSVGTHTVWESAWEVEGRIWAGEWIQREWLNVKNS